MEGPDRSGERGEGGESGGTLRADAEEWSELLIVNGVALLQEELVDMGAAPLVALS